METFYESEEAGLSLTLRRWLGSFRVCDLRDDASLHEVVGRLLHLPMAEFPIWLQAPARDFRLMLLGDTFTCESNLAECVAFAQNRIGGMTLAQRGVMTGAMMELCQQLLAGNPDERRLRPYIHPL